MFGIHVKFIQLSCGAKPDQAFPVSPVIKRGEEIPVYADKNRMRIVRVDFYKIDFATGREAVKGLPSASVRMGRFGADRDDQSE